MGKKLVALAVLVGLAASLCVYGYIKKVEREARQRRLAPVVVAVRDIGGRELITGEMVALREVPAEAVHPRAAKKLEDVVGSVAFLPIVSGEQVLLARVVRPGEIKGGLSFQVPPGKRAVSVNVDEVKSVGFLLKQGDRVDVLLKIPVAPGGAASGGSSVEVAATVLQNVEVLAVGRSLEQPKAETGGKEGEGAKPQQQAKEVATVTLAVAPQEAQVLLLASELGSVRLALRSPVDGEVRDLAPIDTETMIRDFAGGAALLERLAFEAEAARAKERAGTAGSGNAPYPAAAAGKAELWSVFEEGGSAR